MKRLFLTFLGMALSCVAWSEDAPEVKTAPPPFEVEISIDDASIGTDLYKTEHRFFVKTRVRNTTQQDEDIVIWTQYGWSWSSDNETVAPMQEAAKNASSILTLKPGFTYDMPMIVQLQSLPQEPLTFRLGFTPKPESPAPAYATDAQAGIIWSNKVTLTP